MEAMTIPLEVVLDLPSVDATWGFSDRYDDGPWGKVRDILDKKAQENEYREWDHTWQQTFPIHLFIGGRDERAVSAYGIWDVPREYHGRLIMGNGHHRVAHLHKLGREFARFTFDIHESDW